MNINEILQKYNIDTTEEDLLSFWNMPHRHYHNINHLNDLLKQIDDSSYNKELKEKLYLVAYFHDIVYDVLRGDNEEQSGNYYMSLADKTDTNFEIYEAILDTKKHNGATELSKTFCEMDMNIVTRKYEELLEWEDGIQKEYAVYKEKYKPGRIYFLKSLPQNEDIKKLIEYVKKY